MECGAPLAAGSPAQLCGACLWSDGGDAGTGLLKVPGHDVLEELARGGMGVVYRARERETQRTVALKMLRPRLADEEGMRERFRMEAAAVAALDHPHILPVFRVDETDDMPFFTMKLAAGGTLAERRDQLRGRWRDIAALMATLADAVQYAHQHGVLHRDLKPGNVLFDEEGRAYLTDFGLVKLIDSVSELTGSQNFLGTPHYSSPEVATSNASAATVISDVWSLGAMLYELLSGRLPFDAPSLPPLLRKIAEDPPPPLETAVPGDLRVIALKCLHKDPGQRYGSAAGFGADLRAWLEGRPITARAASLPERALAWSKRNPLLAAMAGALAALLALVGVLLWRGYSSSQRSAEEARAGEAAARAAQAKSLLDGTRAQLRDGQWVKRAEVIRDVLRSHELNPADKAPDVLVSVLALPELVQTADISYSRQNPNPYAGAGVCLSDDFSRYVARTKDATEVRDTATHATLHTVPEVAAPGYEPGPLSGDGRLLGIRTAAGYSVWQVETGVNLATLTAGPGPLVFSRDGTLAAAGNRLLRFTADPPEVLDLADKDYAALAISPDGKMLLTAHRSQLRMRLVDTATGARLGDEYELTGRSMMLCAAWSSQGTHFCTGSTDGRMMLWSVRSAAPEWIVPAHTDGIDDITLFNDDRHLVTVSRDGLTKIWNLHSQSAVAAFPLSGRRAQASRDGRRLALDAAAERSTVLLQFTPPPVCTLVRLPASFVPDGSFQGKGAVLPAADGQSFAVTAGVDLHILDRDGQRQRSIPCGQCAEIVADPLGRGFIRLRVLRSGVWQLMRVPHEAARDLGSANYMISQGRRMPSLASDPVHRRFVTGMRGAIMEVEPADGSQTPRTPAELPPSGRVTALAFSPDGNRFAWAGGEEDATDPARRLHIMDAALEKRTAELPLTVAPRLLAFSSDGNSIIAGNNQSFHCLDIATRRELWSVRHFRAQEPTLKTPICLAVAAQSGAIAAALTPDSVSLLDPATGRIRLTLRHPMGHTLRAIGLSPDGTRLIAVGSYIAQVWKLDAVAEELARHGMTF